MTPTKEELAGAAIASHGNKSVAVRFQFGRWVAVTEIGWNIRPRFKGRTQVSGWMHRSSVLNTPKEVRRWGKRHGIDVERVASDLEHRIAR